MEPSSFPNIRIERQATFDADQGQRFSLASTVYMVGNTDLNGKRVLVVEDDFLVAEALCDALRDAGASPIGPVASAGKAVEAITHEALDGVLLDVKLQGINGMKVAECLRLKKVPFLLITGYDRQALHPRLQTAPYLAKPALMSELVEKAAALFGAVQRGH